MVNWTGSRKDTIMGDLYQSTVVLSFKILCLPKKYIPKKYTSENSLSPAAEVRLSRLKPKARETKSAAEGAP